MINTNPQFTAPEAAHQILKSAVSAYEEILLGLRQRETDKLEKMEKKMKELKKPSASAAQHAAMGAAASGKSQLGIPKKVGEEFLEADKGKHFKKDAVKEMKSVVAGLPAPKDPAGLKGVQTKMGEVKQKMKKLKQKNLSSIFKKMIEMDKGEACPGGKIKTIKLGKQEFYIDLKNASDPKKRVIETNPVEGAKVPGGKETGWKNDGLKSKEIENSASGGEVSPNKIAKAGVSMAAPKPPTAPGAGSPSLRAQAPAKPPAKAASANPLGKAQPGTLRGDALQAAFQAKPKEEPGVKATVQAKSPTEFDPSLYQPKGLVHSGLELDVPKPKSVSPAFLKNIKGFKSVAKGELCKVCSKMHKGACDN